MVAASCNVILVGLPFQFQFFQIEHSFVTAHNHIGIGQDNIVSNRIMVFKLVVNEAIEDAHAIFSR
jgi:hypothetical protein